MWVLYAVNNPIQLRTQLEKLFGIMIHSSTLSKALHQFEFAVCVTTKKA